MSGDRIKLTVKERDSLGSAETRRLRKDGYIPGVLYGKDEPRAIAIEERALRHALTGDSGLHAVLDVVLEGQKTTHPSILKEYQQHPVRGFISHVDFHEVRLDRPIQASVSVTLVGGDESPGVGEGGVLSQPTQELNVEALPMEVPDHIDADVSKLEMGDMLRLEDIARIEGVTFLDDPHETVIAAVTMPRAEEEPETTPAEGAEAEEGAEPAVGEEPGEGGGDESEGDQPDSTEG